MNNIAISLKGVSKRYILHHEKPTLVENVLARKQNEEFWALKDINLTIKKGDRVGIYGPNGSGKSTLLEIIAGITVPTTGYVFSQGRLVSIIELRAGFQPDLTGEENILLNGLLLGMSKRHIYNNMKSIIKFADIGSFIDTPFYTYSDGMALRLGFSIAIHANPDILLLDESFGFGDETFRKKILRKIQQFFKKKETLVIVSHWLDFLKKNCDYVLELKSGRISKVIQ